MLKLNKWINKGIDSQTKWLLMHQKVKVILILLPTILIYILLMLRIPITLSIIFLFYSTWLFCFSPKLLNFFLKTIKIVYSFACWMKTNILNFKHVFFYLIYTFFALLILVAILIFIGIGVERYLSYHQYIKDPIFNGQFIPNAVTCGVSIIAMFFVSIIANWISLKYFYNKWSVTIVGTLLTFLVAILFTFILGLSTVFAEYFELLWKSSVNLEGASPQQLKELTFFHQSQFNLAIYWSFAMLLSYKTTFDLVNRSKRKNAINDTVTANTSDSTQAD